jgi:hypothetical protein
MTLGSRVDLAGLTWKKNFCRLLSDQMVNDDENGNRGGARESPVIEFCSNAAILAFPFKKPEREIGAKTLGTKEIAYPR